MDARRPGKSRRAFHGQRCRPFTARRSLAPRVDGVLHGKDEVFSYYRDGLAASSGLRFSLIEVCTGVDDITIVYRDHRDVLVTEALTFRDDGLACEVRVGYGV